MQTLQVLLDSGMPLETALPAFTSNVADILRLRDRGRIQAGNIADLVVLEDNGDIRDVMVGGAWHVAEGAATYSRKV